MTAVKSLGDTTERTSRAGLRNQKASVISRREPLAVPPGTSLREGIARMQERNSGVLLVVEQGRVIGALTEGDVVKRVIGRGLDPETQVDAVMTKAPTTLPVDGTVGDAMRLMEQGGYRMLPLVDADGRLTGIVHQREVLEYVAEAFPQEILNLPPRPHQQMEEPEGA